SAWIIVLLWEPLGGWIILILALVYAMLSVLLGRAAIRLIREGRLGLPQTIAELRQDRDALVTEDAR
ncbi:MAG: phage holin family protein, partial [Oxalobacteraceae bacterium]|nr:phage holin family protein [Oxalobacteraceae bacterium]